MKDMMEVCPLSREGMFHPLSAPLPGRFRFFHLSSARSSIGFPCGSLSHAWESYGFTVFCAWTISEVGSSFSPVAMMFATENQPVSVPATVPFGPSLSASLACSC